MIVSPAFTGGLSFPTRSSTRAEAPVPWSRRPTAARFFWSTARTALLGSVISVTRDSPPKTFEIVPTRPSFVITTSLSLIAVAAPGRDGDALVERRRAREDARADLVEVLREARPLNVVQELLELDVVRARARQLRVDAPQARVLGPQPLVLRLRLEEPVRPVGRVAERVRHPVGGDLERTQGRGRGALDRIERRRAERDGQQGKREHDQTHHDEPTPEGARTGRGVAGGSGALDGGAQDRNADVPVARHERGRV